MNMCHRYIEYEALPIGMRAGAQNRTALACPREGEKRASRRSAPEPRYSTVKPTVYEKRLAARGNKIGIRIQLITQVSRM
jgi:hypothetical protein